MLDLQTPVLDGLKPGIEGSASRLIVAQTELEPDNLRSNLDRLIDSDHATA
jgi:hypothetical protein